MNLLNVVTARAIWLFDVNELNPSGKALFPELFGWLEKEYHFNRVPKSVTDVDETKALVFSGGTFQVKEKTVINVELKIYNDGFVANTWSSTHAAETFLEHISISGKEEFSLSYKPEIIRRKMYLSELNVESLRELIGINQKLSQLNVKVTELIPGILRPTFEVGGITLSPAQCMTPQLLSPFRLERKLNTSPDEHKYYSSAPLHTDDHLKLLDWFEENLMA